ncbi:MAG TPA: IS200/IS605 family transposase [Terriglobia bacterium]|nr:IS200/IS605 family transposase [Terriglobia bacterium]
MAHTYTKLLAHFIFSTKDRAPNLHPSARAELFPYMLGILRNIDTTVLALNGSADHVHLLAALPPILSVAEAMRVLKANSSRWANERGLVRGRFAWQEGYGAFSVSQSNVSAVAHYIARQEEHHRKITFQEEFLEFLKKHGIVYDERYIWT